jgi:hypothetical protein
MSRDDSEQDQKEDEQEKAFEREERDLRREEGEAEDVSGDTPASHRDPEVVGDVLEGSDKEQLDVPQITVELGSRLDSTDFISGLPGGGGKSVQVPQVQTQSTLRLKAGDITDTILKGSETGLPSVPQFSRSNIDRLRPVDFDDDQLEGVKRVQQVQVPQIKIGAQKRFQPFSTFLETVPEITAEDKDAEEGATEAVEKEGFETIQITERPGDSIDEAGAGSEWVEGEWPDPLELLFGSGGTDIKSGSPLVIKADSDGSVGVVETLVKRRYREIEGGEPDLKKFDTADQLANEERWISADSQIFTAQLREKEWEKLEEDHQEEWQSIWNNKIDQLFSGQRFGAIIFNCVSLPSPELISLPHHPPAQVELDQGSNWKDIGRIFWTGLDQVEPRKMRTFSQVFDWDADGVAKDRRLEILQALDAKFDFATDGDDEASDEHYVLKVFVVKWLAEKLWESGREFSGYDDLRDVGYREIEETILTEQLLTKGDNLVRPDVRYGPRVFEVEMFFGEGDGNGVISKLQDTVRKYEEFDGQINAINIVVDNQTCLLHLKDLAQFKRNHKIWEEDYADINLYTIDLGREELVSVGSIVDKITSL